MKQFFHVLLYQPLYNLLMFFAWAIPGHNIGIAIIILTILIRFALWPSSIKAAYVQVKSQALQPKINRLKSEIKDQQEQSKALMQLYKDEGISPFGSCLPLLIQLPILWVLFSVFRNGLSVAGFKDLYTFMPRLDVINTHFLGYDLTKASGWVLPIVAGLFQLLLSWLMMPKKDKNEKKEANNGDPMAMMSKQMLFLPSVFTVFFGRTMPAALVIYWITTTIFGIFQQLYVNKVIRNEKVVLDPSPVLDMLDNKSTQQQIEEPKKPSAKDTLYKMMNKKLDKNEKKAGVNVTVRTKK